MRKYLQIIKSTWDEGLNYRISFVIYRLRSVLQLMTIFFLWQFIVPKGSTFAGYSQPMLMSYVIGSQLVNAIVMSSRAQEIAADINEGNLSNFLLRPMNCISYWFARDIGDKALNVVFSFFELGGFYFIFRPELFIQTNFLIVVECLLLVVLGTILYFYFSVIISLLGFWNNETWGPRFIFYQLLLFLAGGLFPLDMLPKSIYSVLTYLPFSYLLFFPLKTYLGQVDQVILLRGLTVMFFWIGIMHVLTVRVWQKGLKAYTAQGR